jgi:hypothetical protein
MVTRLSGSESATTRDFDVQAPWILDWRVSTDFPQAMAIEISLVDAVTGFHDGQILQTKYQGNGVRLFNKSGRFRFRVSSTLTKWNLRVEELTRQEAEEYKPRDTG